MRRSCASAAATSSKICKAATARFSTTARIADRAPLGDGDQLVICDQEFRFYSGHGTGVLDPMRNLEESSIAELVDDTQRRRAAPA